MVLINQFINFKIGGVTITANSTELNYNAGTIPGIVSAEKTVVADLNNDIIGFNTISATNLTGIITTASQPNITSLGTIADLLSSGTNIHGNSGSGILRTTINNNNIYLQPGTTNISGSATNLFITNAQQDITNSSRIFSIMSDGKVGIQSNNPTKQLEINSSNGNNLRLTYNNNSGSATNFTDFSTDFNGNFIIGTSGNLTQITKKLQVNDVILNFNTGGLLVKSISTNNNIGRVINTEITNTLNITNYNTGSITDNFSLEIIGYIRPLYTETYTFFIGWDDDIRFFINGELLLNKVGVGAGSNTASNTISLIANVWYPIFIQNSETTGTQLVQVEWSSISQTREFIPSSRMAWDNKEPSVQMKSNIGDKLTLFNTSSHTLPSIVSLNCTSTGNLNIIPTNKFVGINKSVPTSILHLFSNETSNDTINVENTTTSGYASINHISNLVNWSSGARSSLNSTAPNSYFINGGSSPSLKLVINSDGNVGINTVKADRKLEINDTNGNCLRLTFNDSDGSATTYSDFLMKNTGSLEITTTGGLLKLLSSGINNELNISSSSVLLNLDSTLNTSSSDIQFNTSGNDWVLTGRGSSNSTNPNTFSIYDNTNSLYRLILDTSGNINIVAHNNSTVGLRLGGTLITSSAVELNYLDLTTGPGTAQVSKALVLDSSSNITGINSLTATTLVGTLSTPAQPNITSLGTLTGLSINGTTILGNTSGSRFRILESSSVLLIQAGSSATTGSSADIFIGNYDQIPSSSSRKIMFKADGSVGIGTSTPTNQLEVNHSTGSCLRLTNNSTNYADFGISSGGDLTITPVGGDTTIVGNLLATITTSSQPNITSLGTLTSLTMSGALSGATTISASGIVTLTNATASTTTSTGALVITGGLGVGGAVRTGGLLAISGSLSGVTTLGASGIVTLTSGTSSTSTTTGTLVVTGGIGSSGAIFASNLRTTGNVGIGITSPTQLLDIQNTGTDNYIRVGAGGYEANFSGLLLTEVGLNYGWHIRHSALSDNLTIGYQSDLTTFTTLLNFRRNLISLEIPVSTASTTTTTGALVITGGLGISGAIHSGSTINTSGIVTITNTTASTTPTTGALVVTGGLGISGAVRTGGLLAISGALSGVTTLGASGAVTMTANTTSTTTTTGTLVVTGGIGVSGAVNATSLGGTLTTPAQTAITSVGTLTGLTMSGVISGVTTLSATTLSGTLSTASQPNITSIGTLTGLTMSGAISGVSTLTATTLTGTLSTVAQTAITSIGTLTNLNVAGNIGLGTISPTEKLDIYQGNIRLSDTNSYSNNRYIYTDWDDVDNNHQIGLEFDYYAGSGNTNTTHSMLNFISNSVNGELINGINKVNMMSILSNGLVGIGTTNPRKHLEINSTTGNCLRLSYNDSDGSTTNYADFIMSSSGDLSITPYGGDLNIYGNTIITGDTTITGVLNATFSTIVINDKLGVGTSLPTHQLEVNNSEGNCLRLTYNEANGGASVYTDLLVSPTGDLTITSSGSNTIITNNLQVNKAIANFNTGGLIINTISTNNNIGRITKTTITTTLNIIDYDTNYFSLEIIGYIQPLYSETYTFFIGWNDDIRFFINGELLLNKVGAGIGTGVSSNTIALLADVWYPIFIQNSETTGTQSVQVEWSSTSQTREFIPSIRMAWDNKETNITRKPFAGDSLNIFSLGTTSTPSTVSLNCSTTGDLSIVPSGGDTTITGTLSGITTLTATTLAGTLSTVAQPNITSLGTLTSLNITSITEPNLILSQTVSTKYSGIQYLSSGNDWISGAGGSGHSKANRYFIFDITNSLFRFEINSAGSVNIIAHDNSTVGLQLGGVLVTSSATELNYLDLTTGPGTAQASKALVLNSSSNITGINSLTATSLVGTITTASQPNITSLGTLTGLTMGGSISGVTTLTATSLVGTITTTSQPNITSLGTLTGLTMGGSISGVTTLTATSLVGTINTVSQPNITSLGTLTGLTMSGSISGVTTLTATSLVGTITTASQPNITSLGTLTGLTMGGSISGVTTLTATSLVGTITTASQPNITSLGTLTGLTVTNNIGISTASPTEKLNIYQGNIRLSDINSYTNNRYIYTDWEDVSNNHQIGLEFDYYTGSGNTITTHSMINFISNSFNGEQISGTNKVNMMSILSNGLVGIGTTNPGRQLEINSSNGNCLRLTYNDPNGDALYHSDFLINSSGDLTIRPSGSYVYMDAGFIIDTTSTFAFVVRKNNVGGDVFTINTTSNIVNINGNLVLSGTGVVSGITTLTATTLTGTLSTASQTAITSVGTLTSLRTSGTVGIGTTTPGKQLEINSATGDCLRLTNNDPDGDASNYADLTVNSTGDLTVKANSGTIDLLGYSLTKITDINLTSQSNTTFYPVAISKTLIGTYGNYPNINFQITGIDLLSSNTYNENTLIGYARGGGNSDHSSLYNITIRKFSETEHRILGLYFGTTDFYNGFVIYLRGGYGYTIQCDGNSIVNTGTIGSTLTVNSSTFATKNVSFNDVTGTSANINLAQSLLVNSGTYTNLQYTTTSNITGVNISGTLTTVAQPNITSIGTLSGLSVNGASILGNTSGSRLRIVEHSNILYLQPGTSASSSSSADLFIGNMLETNITSSRKIIFKANGKVGIGTNAPGMELEVNNITGQCLRLSYNNSDGTGSFYSDFTVSSSGDLTIAPVGTDTNITGNLAVSGILTAGSFSVTSLAATITTPAQPNITSLGIISNLRITGNVGIGITSPSQILDIQNIDTDNYIRIGAGSTTTNFSGLLLTERNIDYGWHIRHSALSDNLTIGYHADMTTFNTLLNFRRTLVSLEIPVSTVSTSTTTGALVIAGGLGIGGATNLTTIRTTGNVGIGTTTPSKQLEINHANGECLRLTYNNTSFYSDFTVSSSGDLTIAPVGTDTNITGNLAITGALSGVTTLSTSGIVTLTSGTASTTTTTGTLVVTGGIGISGAINTGGIVTLTNATASTTTGTGALVITGGMGIGGDVFVGGITNISNSTTSTNTTTGALVVTGGVGIGGAVRTGGLLAISGALSGVTTLGASGAVTMTAGTTSTTTTTGTLVVTGGVGVSGTLNATSLGGTLTTAAQTAITSVGTLTSLTLAGALSGVTTLGASGIVTLTNATASTTTGTGALVITGGLGVGGAVRTGGLLAISGALSGVTTLGASGIVTLTNATASTTTGTGALVITGGLGVGGAVRTGGLLAISGALSGVTTLGASGIITLSNTTATTSNSTGAILLSGGLAISNTTDAISSTNGGTLTTAGGAAIAKSLYVGQNLSVAGNLTVSGTTTTIESITTVINDNTLLLNSGPSGSGYDSGFLTHRYQIANQAGTGDVVTDIAKASFALDAATSLSITLPSGANATNDYYNNWWIKITSGAGMNNVRQIIGYNGTTKVATLASAFTNIPSATHTVNLYNKPYSTFLWQEASNSFVSAFVASDATSALNIIDYADFTCNNLVTSSINVSVLDISGHNGIDTGLSLGGVLVTATAAQLNSTGTFSGVTATTAELNYNDLTTGPGTAQASKSLVLDSSSNITGINSLTATSLGGTLTTVAQPNITSIGTLTSLTLSGALSGVTTLGASGIVTLTNATASTTPTTGALVVTGGLGVGGAVRTGGLLAISGALSGVTTLGASGVVTMTAGTASTTTTTGTLVVTGGVGVSGTLNATSLGGTLTTVAQPNITSIGTLTSLTLSGALSGVTTLGASGIVTLTNATASTTTTTGALVITGGLGVGGAVRTGSLLAISGALSGVTTLGASGIVTLTNTTASTTTGTGALVITGGLGVGGAVRTGGLLAISGALSGVTTLGASGAVTMTAGTASTTTTTGTLVVTGGVGISGTLNTNGANINGTIIAGNLSGSRLRILESSSILYLQVGTSATTNSAADLFIGNYAEEMDTSSRKIIFKGDGKVGFGTHIPSKQLEINHANGECLRLTYNNTSFYSDFTVNSTGDLTITPSGDNTIITNNLQVNKAIANFNTGGLIINTITSNNNIGRIIKTDITTTLNITDYNNGSLTDNFSLEIIGYIQPLYSETYTFFISWDDDVRIFIDNTLIFNKVSAGIGTGVSSNTIALLANVWYPIFIQNSEQSGGQIIQVEWSSTSQTREFIPSIRMAWDNKGTNITRKPFAGDSLNIFSLGTTSTPSTVSLNCSTTGDLSIVPSGGDTTITGTLSGITTLTATTLAGTLSTVAQPNITSLGQLTGLTLNGTTNDTYFTIDSGDKLNIKTGTTSDIAYVEYNLTRAVSIILSTVATTTFIPVVIYQNKIGDYGEFPVINFQITGNNFISSNPYNETTLVGYARGSGSSDHNDLFNITLRNFSESESRFLGLYKGTDTFRGGFAIYLRGGYDYTIQVDSNATIDYNELTEITINNSTFAHKNNSDMDITGTSANTLIMQTLLTSSGNYTNLVNYTLQSDMANSTFIVNGLGKKRSLNNQAEFGYNHVIDNSTSNYGFVGMFGSANAITWNGPKCVGIGKAPATTTVTSSSTTGALTIAGGLGLTGNIMTDSKISIGVDIARSDLHIKQSLNTSGGGLILESNNSGADWNLLINASNRLEFLYDTSTRGYLDPSTNVANIDFTGQHRNITDNDDINNNIEKYIGLIVYATGTYNNLNNSSIEINEALPKVELTNIYQDKRVFGVISNREDSNSDRTYTQGSFVSVLDKIEGDERLIINSVGEGMVWICDKNGPIENGDLIVSAGVSGYGTKQETIFVCNYTVGKITQDCDFSTPERYADLLGNVVSKSVYDTNPSNHVKCNFVGCVYYCG